MYFLWIFFKLIEKNLRLKFIILLINEIMEFIYFLINLVELDVLIYLVF